MSNVQHTHISARHSLFDLKLGEFWQYRELVLLFTQRSFIINYKQTILGPLWQFITPLMSSIVYVILFGQIAKLSTDGVPQLLFYLSGNALWSFFNACLDHTSKTFSDNRYLFDKVYFPRLTVPAASVCTAVVRFGIQMLLAVVLMIWYVSQGICVIHPFRLLLIPLLLFWVGLLALGIGVLISSVTTKYRDLGIIVGYGMSLWMYITPVVYPMSMIQGWLRTCMMFNPVAMPMELFRWAFLGTGTILPLSIVLSVAITLLAAFLGIIVFNHVERTFMDTI